MKHDEHFLISSISNAHFDKLYAISFVYLFYYNVLLNNAEIVYHINQIISKYHPINKTSHVYIYISYKLCLSFIICLTI